VKAGEVERLTRLEKANALLKKVLTEAELEETMLDEFHV
jgi:hypothetical protein